MSIVFPGKTNLSTQRIKGVPPVTGQAKSPTATHESITFQPGTEFYFEEGELAH